MKKNEIPSSKKPISSDTAKLLVYLLLNSAALLFLYFFISEKLRFPYISYIYLAAGAVFGLYYVIYNRGFVAKDATIDMLPDTMTPLEKQKFLDDGKERLHKSRWVLTILVPIILTFMADMIYLFLFPMITEIFS